jgi:23S rRNA-/tRNA-specific pseudouridylate synthase
LHWSECWHFRGAEDCAVADELRLPLELSYLEPTLKLRLDKLLVDRGLAASRERAQALILAGKVLVNDQKVDKAGAQVLGDAVVRLLGEMSRARCVWMSVPRPAGSQIVYCSGAQAV